MAGVIAKDGLYNSGPGVDTPDVVRPLAGQVHVAIPVHGHAAGAVQFRVQRRTAVAAPADRPVAGDAGDDAGLVIDAADRVVAQVGEIHVAVAVLVQVMGIAEPRFSGRTAVARVARDTVPGKGVEDPVAIDAPDAVPLVVDHDQVAVGPARHAHGPTGVGLFRRNTRALAHAGDNQGFSGGQVLEPINNAHA